MWERTFHVLPTGKAFFKILIKADKYFDLARTCYQAFVVSCVALQSCESAKGCQCTEIGVGSN